MPLFLIRNKRTRENLSVLDSKGRVRRRGHTHAILSSTQPPRLFTTERGAKYALTAWLAGPTTRKYGVDYNGDEFEDWNTTSDPSRKAKDMEIRKCKVVLS
jgi:hypothetical protein